MPVIPRSIDLATLATLTGDLASTYLLARTRETGHPSLRPSHGYVFQSLIDAEPTVGELAEALGVSQQAASKSVADLEALGYAQRVADRSDARIRRVRLTARGEDAIEAGRAARAELEERLLERVDAASIDAARDALAALLDLVDGTDAIARRRVPLPPRAEP